MAKVSSAIQHYARLGALVKLQQLDRERAEILRAFPGIQHAKHATLLRVAPAPRRASAAARRAMSEGMRKFWAKRKGAAK